MQRFFTPLILLLVLISTLSFESRRESARNGSTFKKDGFFTAMVDGQYFTVREQNKYNTELVMRSAELAHQKSTGTQKITQLINQVSFYGNQFFDENGNTAEERINFEYAFHENIQGRVEGAKVMLHFNNDKYYNLPNETNFTIVKKQWSPDRRFFLLTADFDCKMRRWGIPASSQEVVRLKGRMENITVTVPAWSVATPPDRVLLED